MEAWKKHWLSRDFLAPNVMEIDIDNDVFASAFDLVPEIQQVEAGPEAITLASGLHFNVLSMSSTWSSDMLWIAQDDIRTYEFFEKLFRASGISRHVADRIDFEGFLRLTRAYLSPEADVKRPICMWIMSREITTPSRLSCR